MLQTKGRSPMKCLLITVVLLAGCMSAGTQVDPAKVSGFQKGVTTYAEVASALGAPNSVSDLSDGSKIAVYAYTHAAARPQSFIPILGPLVATADASMQTYTFTFDAAGVLRSRSSTQTQATSGMGVGH